jgi:creatinine amidohydrolase
VTQTRLASLTWPEAREAVESNQLVVLPVGSTEAHGPHLPLDVDSHQVGYIAELVAERTGALVAPTLPYGYATTWMEFPGTMTFQADTYQQVLFELVSSILEHGFRRVMILNGHRPNNTSVDVAARRAIDGLPRDSEATVTAVSYWEPGAVRVHALRRSRLGGMGHACEFETSVQLATRPELVKMDRLANVRPPLVGWDLVGPSEPARTYGRWPAPSAEHPAIFGDPTVASAESGRAFLEAVVDSLVEFVRELEAGRAGSYTERPEPSVPATASAR